MGYKRNKPVGMCSFRRYWTKCFGRSDEGAVTAEFAVVLPAVMIAAVLILMLARASTVAMTCQDAASAAARTAIISKDDNKTKTVARNAAGADVDVSVARMNGQVEIVVSCPIVSDPLHVLPKVVHGRAIGEEQ